MQDELLKILTVYTVKLEEMSLYLDIEKKTDELERLEYIASDPSFWDNQVVAQENINSTRIIKQVLDPYYLIKESLENAHILADMVKTDEKGAIEELKSELDKVVEMYNDLELKSLLGGEFDHNNAYLTLHAGAGGTESCDWADMLYRMYVRYAERQGFKVKVLDFQAGDEAGVKSVSLLIEGSYAYGLLKAERGVHRLVRISPFDSQSRRHTSFSATDVSPELDDNIEIDLIDADLRIDTFRAQGAGGQHVNTTDSAVRIVHMPTGTVVQCQAERSQHKNRASAMKMLKARLYEIEQDKKRQLVDQLYSKKGEIAWGSQIRSYVMQPYTMVKDHRTEEQLGNVNAVLDGDLNTLIHAYLKKRKNEYLRKNYQRQTVRGRIFKKTNACR